MAGLTGLSHAGFASSDLDRTVDFYTRVLGARVQWQTERQIKLYVGDLGLAIPLARSITRPIFQLRDAAAEIGGGGRKDYEDLSLTARDEIGDLARSFLKMVTDLQAAADREKKLVAAEITGPQATPRGLRHRFGVHAIGSKVPEGTLQRWIGHARLRNTHIYTFAVGADEIALARRMW